MKTLFHKSILDHLNSQSLNPTPMVSSNVQDKQLVCEVIAIGNRSTTASRLSYRAEVFGTQTVHSRTLVSSIATWVKGGVVLPLVTRGNTSNMDIMLIPDCPVSIERVSEPLCRTGHVQSILSVMVSDRDGRPSWSVPWWAFVISMVTEMVVMVVVFLAVVLIICHMRTTHR